MANNKFYGYTPKYGKGNVEVPHGNDNTLDRFNPYEFKKGMDFELTSLGCNRLAESTKEEREKATEKVLKNLEYHSGYYSGMLHYISETNNRGKDNKLPAFKTWLKEFYEENSMKPVGKPYERGKMTTPSYKSDKMTEPKYDKTDYTVQLKEAIKNEIRNILEGKKKGEDEEYDLDIDSEPTSKAVKNADLKGLQDAVLDTKDALAYATKKVKELAPDIKKLAKEVNAKIKKNPEGREGYLKVYQTDPDVEEFIKLRKMLKAADLL